jgi:glucokinase
MSSQIFYVDFSADNSVRMTAAEPGQRPPASYLEYCHSLEDLGRAFDSFLDRMDHPQLEGAAFSLCGWEREGAFEMPNHSYSLCRDWARGHLNVNRLHLVNDCVAVALAVDHLTPSERITLCEGQSDPDQPKALVAIGRSLGTTCVVPDDFGNGVAIPCAGGYTDLPVANRREYEVFEAFANRYGRVSRARAVCTAGLEEVYSILARLEGRHVNEIRIQTIVELARNQDPVAIEAIDMVTGWLASLASDVALFNGARGGVYLAGSFFDHLGDVFDRDRFAARFLNKGRVSNYLSGIIVQQVKAQDPEMIGLSSLFN